MRSVTDSYDESIERAINAGTLDADAHAAPIAAARKLAQMMDGPNWPMVNGKLDNVSPGVFLKYCDALGIVPGKEAKAKTEKPRIVSVAGNSRWKQKAANG